MKLTRSEEFDADLESQMRWYLMEAGLEPDDGKKIGESFATAVDKALDFLCLNPGAGRPRLATFVGLIGVRSWAVDKPFGRFLIFYHSDGSTLVADRLIEGHRGLAGS